MMQSMSQTALLAPGPEITALRALFTKLVQKPDAAAHMAHLLAGSDVRYDGPDGYVAWAADQREMADIERLHVAPACWFGQADTRRAERYVMLAAFGHRTLRISYFRTRLVFAAQR